jgi:hypothetical protein
MNPPPVRLHRWDEIALEKVTEMISRKLITGEREMIAHIHLKRGALVPMHSHESEQMTYVFQGVPLPSTIRSGSQPCFSPSTRRSVRPEVSG